MREQSGFFCKDYNITGKVFFPKNYTDDEILEAKIYCNVCDRRDECLQVAIHYRINEGIYGGMTPPERDRYRVIEALKVSKVYVSQRNTLREQLRLEHESRVSPLYNSYLQNHTPLVLQWAVEEQQPSQLEQPKFELTLLSWESPSETNQNFHP